MVGACAPPALHEALLDKMPDKSNDTRTQILTTVRRFVREEVLPRVKAEERADTYPEALLSRMGDLGLFAMAVPEEYGGLELPYELIAEAFFELSQGWMSLSGALTSHGTVASMLVKFGTEDQKRRYLPRMATGELRFCFSMTEPDAGSDAQAIRTRAEPVEGGYVLTGTKTWATHALNAGAVMLLVVTDPQQVPRHRGISAFVVEKEPGVNVIGEGIRISNLEKLGYKGVESSEIVFDSYRVPSTAVLGGAAGLGKGFKYFMSGLEGGRIQVAASAVGIALGALKRSLHYARERQAFGKRIGDHQAVQLTLADMSLRVEASRQMVLHAARRFDAGDRADIECAMAKILATETAAKVALDAMRVHGGYGYSTEFTVERFYREVPSLLLGEGSNEINQILIAKRLIEDDSSIFL